MRQTHSVLTPEIMHTLLPKRKARSNKGTYGRVLLRAGSQGMAGAALLAAEAAYRCGCGLVAVAGPEENRAILQIGLPEAIYLSLDQLPKRYEWGTVLAAGPGMGVSAQSLAQLTHALRQVHIPMILDADALNLLAAHPQLWETLKGKRVVITPHPGEMSRLSQRSIADILADPVSVAVQFAAAHHCVCILKDEATVVTDGRDVYVNTSGCDGMACGGSGDVLTGMLAGLLAQDPNMDLFSLGALGVYLHGLAGEAAGAHLGMRSMLARDLIAHIPDALNHLSDASSHQ